MPFTGRVAKTFRVVTLFVTVSTVIATGLGSSVAFAETGGDATPTGTTSPTASESSTPDPAPSTTEPTSAPEATSTTGDGTNPSDAPSTSADDVVLADPTISSDRSDYSPGDTVTLTGTNWDPGEDVRIVVNDDAGETWRRDVTVQAGAAGNITDVFTLPTWFIANYSVIATGADGRVARTSFTDAATDWEQCTNDSTNDGVKDDCDWTDGAVNANNSIYTEGQAVAQRLLQSFDVAGPHSITFEYDFSKNDEYAYDFLVGPNFTQDTAALLQQCNQVDIVSVATCNSIYGGATDVPIPSDPFDAVAARETTAATRFMRIGSTGTIGSPSISFVPLPTNGHTPSTTCFQNCGTSSVLVKVSFTTASANQVVGLWFAAHLAAGFDPPGNQQGWGAGFGASSVSGSPYHVSLAALDDGSIGGRDNQVSAGGIEPPATAIIKKVTSPSGVSDTFDFTFNGSSNFPNGTPLPSIGDGQTITVSGLVPGTYPAVEADPSPNYALSGITCDDLNSTGTTGTRTANFVLAAGETVTCTFTNSRQTGTLRVIKHVENNDGGTATASQWPMHVKSGGSDVTGSPQNGAESPGTTYTLVAGSYTVSEGAGPANYTLSGFSGDCDSSGAVTVVAGQTKTCTITNNDDTPTLKLVKVVSNNDGGDAKADDFTLSATAAAPDDDRNFNNAGGSGTAKNVYANTTYTLDETTLSGYTEGSWSCDGGTQVGATISVPLGADVTCTITNNDDTPTLKLVKVVSGGSAVANDFTLSATAAAPNDGRNFSNAGGSGTAKDVFANATYTLSETSVAGYTAGSWSCDGGTQVGSTVKVALGADVTCTITNTRDRGSLKVTKFHDLDADGARDANEPFLNGWVIFLDLNKDGIKQVSEPSPTTAGTDGASAPKGEALFSNVETGTYWVCEVLQSPYINSKPGSGSVSPAGTQPCQSVTITKDTETSASFGNYRRGTIIVEKQTEPNGAPGSFTFTGTAAGTIADNGQITVANLVPGTYTSTESDPSGQLFALKSIVCNDADSGGAISTRTATFRLQSGEIVKCVFTNAKDFHPGTIGFWKNWRNHYTNSQVQVLINHLMANNPRVYNKDLVNGTADDLTIAKWDAIFNVGSATPADQKILAQLTALKLNLAITQLDGSGGLVQKNDDICLAGVANVSGIAGATALFGTATPTIGQIVTAVETKWSGNLTATRGDWKFSFTNAQKTTVNAVLDGINNGFIVMSSGC